MWVIDPRRTESAALADEHLATRPGTDVVVLAALARELLERRRRRRRAARLLRARRRRRAQRCARARSRSPAPRAAAGVDAGALDAPGRRPPRAPRAARGRRAAPGRSMGADGILVEWLRWVLLIALGVARPSRWDADSPRRAAAACVRPRPPRRHRSRARRAVPSCPGSPARFPRSRWPTRSKPATCGSLFVTGGNPIGALPEPDRVRAALRQLDALVVVDVMENEITELATHVLPVTGAARTHRHLHVLAPVGALGDAVHPGRRAARRRTAAGVVGARPRRGAGGRRPARRRRSRHAHRRAVPPRDPRALAARRRRPCSPPAPAASTCRSSTAGCTSRCCPTAGGSLAPAVLLERLAAHHEPVAGLVLSPGTRHGLEQLGAVRARRRSRSAPAPPRRRHRRRRRRRRPRLGAQRARRGRRADRRRRPHAHRRRLVGARPSRPQSGPPRSAHAPTSTR